MFVRACGFLCVLCSYAIAENSQCVSVVAVCLGGTGRHRGNDADETKTTTAVAAAATSMPACLRTNTNNPRAHANDRWPKTDT